MDMETVPSQVEVVAPVARTAPLVFASPHSGDRYPAEFLAASRLGPVAIRRSEDAFVDRLFSCATDFGSPLVKALFPRAYVDPNRGPWELDPKMFEDRLPDFVDTKSPRIKAGLGTIARVVTSGEEIYSRKLRFVEARRMIESCYEPYHAALRREIAATRELFGVCLLIDCHSMPSIGGPMDADPGLRRVDMVLGDRFATSCRPSVTQAAQECLEEQGYRVRRNDPYAGGFTTRHYGHPAKGVHALQIEVNRALYMNETDITPLPSMADLQSGLKKLAARLVEVARGL